MPDHYQRDKLNLKKFSLKKRRNNHPDHNQRNERKKNLQNKHKESDALAVSSCSTFPQVTKKEGVAHKGRLEWQNKRQRTQAKGTCSVFFTLVLPFLLNKMM